MDRGITCIGATGRRAWRRASALALAAGFSWLAVGAALAQGPAARPVPGAEELKARHRRSAEEQDRKLRHVDERARRAAQAICSGCLGQAVRGARTQPADPFAPLPDTDDVPLPPTPGLDDEPFGEGVWPGQGQPTPNG
jgi:hypothetical protein